MKRRTLLQASMAALSGSSLLAARAQTSTQAGQDLTWLLNGAPIATDAHLKGMWVKLKPVAAGWGVVSWPINAIHMALLPNGKVLSYGSRGDVQWGGVNGQDGSQTVTWNPDTAQFDWYNVAGRQVPYKNHSDRPTANVVDAYTKFNSFCSGGTLMPNGKLLMVGGSGGVYRVDVQTAASKMTGTYDYRLNQTTKVSDSMPEGGRWYSTVITLADGRQLVVGGMEPYAEDWMDSDSLTPGSPTGLNISRAPMVYQDGQGWTSFPGIPQTTYHRYFELAESRAEYPRAWVAPDGVVFGISTDRMWALDPKGAGNLRDAGNGQFSTEVLVDSGPRRASKDLPNVGSGASSAVMYDKGLVLQAGGNGYWVLNSTYASSKATVVDLRSGAYSASVVPQPPMNKARKFFNTTVLPTGSVLVNGGTSQQDATAAQHQLDSEMFVPDVNDPSRGTFKLMARQNYSRVYHATAVLLPNGTVLSAGGGNPNTVQRNAEIFLPPYLFKSSGLGATWALRPTFSDSNALSANKVAHGDQGARSLVIQLSDTSGANSIKDVVLVGLSTVTHGFNTGQRRIRLESGVDWVAGVSNNKNFIRVVRFPSAEITPPGYYMLFVINQEGVPSRGQIIAVGANTAAPQAA